MFNSSMRAFLVARFIGKMVRLRNGEVCGPIHKRETTGPYCITDGKLDWLENGRYIRGGDTARDIVDVVEPIPFSVDTDGVVLTATPSHGRIYLAGPMAGYPERNYPAFMRAAKALRELGYEVYNPAEYEANGTDEFPLREAFTEYTDYILNRAEIIALLPGHEKSVGATAELSLARVVKLKEIYL
ncbi:hypothetical protein Ab1vBOLIVR4_gp37 [Agrobacterium phage OLIVR4]|nr:hypothetical protein Ab1vBOLIVR4_gp37 [Agrobacterium phage OLIVR4]